MRWTAADLARRGLYAPPVRRVAPRNTKPAKLAPSEHDEQVALVRWADAMSGKHPSLQLLLAIPNGGQRHRIVAAKLRAEGVRAGVPDLFLPVPRGEYSGLWLEMKRREGGRLSRHQEWWRDRLRAQGYRWELAAGADEGAAVLLEYLGCK